MRWIVVAMLIGCGGSDLTPPYDQTYSCLDGCAGSTAVREVKETNYALDGVPYTAVFLYCRCANSANEMKFIRPYDVASCTQLKSVWSGFCG